MGRGAANRFGMKNGAGFLFQKRQVVSQFKYGLAAAVKAWMGGYHFSLMVTDQVVAVSFDGNSFAD